MAKEQNDVAEFATDAGRFLMRVSNVAMVLSMFCFSVAFGAVLNERHDAIDMDGK